MGLECQEDGSVAEKMREEVVGLSAEVTQINQARASSRS